MVTSTKVAEDKVVAMSAETGGGGGGGGGGVPPRTLLEEVNAHLTCVLCRGYYIDATTIVECLHSFCRSCIVKHLQSKKYCPVCEMMINAAKPNIKPDKALQDIVYKLVPGLFQREMERRQQFYSSRPGPAASATPEQRGEDTERIIFSPEDVISFSLEYAEASDADSVSSRSSESGSEAGIAAVQQTRRYLQCPAVVNVSHLKKFLTMKFDIDCTHYCVDILYKRVPLPDYYTLMDIAYIYNWKRNEPMRFFYQIIDYTAIRSRFSFFDINRKGSQFGDRKASPTPTDASAGSPAPPALDPGSDGTSGTSSPMPDDSNVLMNAKGVQDKSTKRFEKAIFQSKLATGIDDSAANISGSKATVLQPLQEVDVEKSQFLNSFELTAKNSSSSPVKNSGPEPVGVTEKQKDPVQIPKPIDSTSAAEKDGVALKRKTMLSESTDVKLKKVDRQKTESEKSPSKITGVQPSSALNSTQKKNVDEPISTPAQLPATALHQQTQQGQKSMTPNRQDQHKAPTKQQVPHEQLLKRTFPGASPNIPSPKRKSTNELVPGTVQTGGAHSSSMSVLPIKSQIQTQEITQKNNENPKHNIKKLPELKLNIPNPGLPTKINVNKPQPMMNRGIRTDLLANNSDPTTDRSKIMSQVKRSLSVQSPNEKSQVSGDPLKSLFDSCKINIPSSLSITLTDQKLDPRNIGDSGMGSDPNKFNKNSSHNGSSGNFSMKSPTPAVQNSIEILKLPDLDPMKPIHQNRTDVPNPVTAPSSTKTPDTPSAKGPVPSLKPISDTKIGKQSNYSKPSPTFHQIFIQSLQQPDKTKAPKSKAPVPKLMPANQKPNSEIQQSSASPSSANTQPSESKNASTSKSDSVLDLSTPHTTQSQLGPHQTKALETMQSIANLAKKQNFPSKPNSSKPLSSIPTPLRIPVQNTQNKPKAGSPVTASPPVTSRLESLNPNKAGPFRPSLSSSPSSVSTNQASHHSSGSAQPSPRSQTRSPSSSPKLVIAEEKQTPLAGSDANQSNQISSSQITSTNTSKNESSSPHPVPGPSKPIPKMAKPPPVVKPANVRFPNSTNKPSGTNSQAVAPGTEMLHSLAPQILAQQQAFMRQQYEMQSQIGHMLPATTEWINKFNQARHIENLMKSLSNAQQLQNDNKK